jgi:5'-nucleotidase
MLLDAFAPGQEEVALRWQVPLRFPMRRRTSWPASAARCALAAVFCATLVACAGRTGTADGAGAPLVRVQVLAINDFHGHLEPPTGSGGVVGDTQVGGAAYLASQLARMRALNPNTVLVSAGDLIGGSPLLSSLFHDEPTIEALDLMGLDFNAVGNHEFDEGVGELLRMQAGGCHPTDGCRDGDGFRGARFGFLAANVRWRDSGLTVFPAYGIRQFEGVRIAFIGLTLEGTPATVSASGVAGLEFDDEAETVNRLVPQLRGQGIEAIVVVVHQGGLPIGAHDDCPGLVGPIVNIVAQLDDAVDLVISGHTHQAYNCTLPNAAGRALPVTSAGYAGRLVTEVELALDRSTGDVVSVRARNHLVTRDVAPDPRQDALISRYGEIAGPLPNRTVGTLLQDITRARTASGESALGNLIADAQLQATAAPEAGGAVVALMNAGGIRADLRFRGDRAGDGEGMLLYQEVFAVHPFGNHLVTMTLTGEQIRALLEQQFPGCGSQTRQNILQVSSGLSYAWRRSAAPCARVDPASLSLHGVMLQPAASYRVTVNSFLAEGGDHFTVLKEGTDRVGGSIDVDALERYIRARSPLAPGPSGRIATVP